MRRNSTYHQTLVPYLLFVAALLYETFASMSLVFTPLLGLGFYYLFHHVQDEERYRDFFLIALYALFVEINRDMILLSFVLFSLLFYKLLFQHIKKYIHCHNCLIVAYVTLGYLGYFIFNMFLAYIFNIPLPIFSIYYPLYMLSDIIIILVLL